MLFTLLERSIGTIDCAFLCELFEECEKYIIWEGSLLWHHLIFVLMLIVEELWQFIIWDSEY